MNKIKKIAIGIVLNDLNVAFHSALERNIERNISNSVHSKRHNLSKSEVRSAESKGSHR